MLRLILRDLWNAYSGTVMRMLAGAFVAAVVLCVVLEAYFRATRPVAACKLTHTVTLSDSADLPAYTAYPPTVAWIRDDY